jgi:YD repeat-containing protein
MAVSVRLTYDLAGQKPSETRGLGTPIQSLYGTWTYGADGEVATVTDANNNQTMNTWDGLNRLAQMNFPLPTLGADAPDPNDFEAYSWDLNSNRLTLAKRDGSTVLTYGYDALNRRTGKAVNLGSTQYHVAYKYDPAGRPVSALYDLVTGTPGVIWGYDSAGRWISEATNGLTLSFGYDSDSNPQTLTWHLRLGKRPLRPSTRPQPPSPSAARRRARASGGHSSLVL